MAPGHRLRMGEISDGLGVAKSAVNKTVDRLEQRGLVLRGRDPDDRRTVYGALSPDGHEVFAAARPVFVCAVQRHFAELRSGASRSWGSRDATVGTPAARRRRTRGAA